MKLSKDPLVHFLVLGGLLFAAHAVWSNLVTRADRELVVDTREIARQSDLFAIENGRAPTDVELQGIIVAFVEEQVLAREAVRLGLDRDDTVIRRRLAQKMRLVMDSGPVAEPEEAELRDWFDANRDEYGQPERRRIDHVFFSADRREDPLADALAADLSDWERAGDPFIVARRFGPEARDKVAQDYGPAFADAAFSLDPGNWTAPVESPFGLHRIRVTDVLPAVAPDFDAARAQVLEDWRRDAQADAAARDLRDRVARYDVVIEE